MIVKPDVATDARRYRSCATGNVSKRAYPTRRDAKKAMARMVNDGEKNLNVYECAQCRVWHVGHRGRPPK